MKFSGPVLFCAALAVAAVPGFIVWGARHHHHVHAIDGDTLVMDGERMRLAGIDAPELRQQCRNDAAAWYDCGKEAKDALEMLIRPPARVECTPTGERSYERVVVRCYADGTDVGATMVWLGHAIDYTRFSGGRYSAQQEAARQARRGIWQGTFIEPEVYRHEIRRKR